GAAEEQSNDNTTAKELVTAVDDVADQSIQSPTPLTPPPQQPQDIPSTSQVQLPPPQQQSPPLAKPQGAHFPTSLLQEALDACAALTRHVEHLEHDKVAQDLEIIKLKTRVKKLERANKEVVEAVTTAKLITEVVAAVSETVSVAPVVQADVFAAPVNVVAVVTTAPLFKVAVHYTRRRRGVVIRDPEEESSAKTPTDTKSKDNGKGIMVEELKPIKKKQQVELDEAYARKLQEELNQEIDWEVAMDHVKQKGKENPYVQRYQVMKKKPQTEDQARRNMMVYLKNTDGFTLDYFKGMEQMEEEESRAILLINETPAQKSAKRRRLNKEAKDVEELKQHLEIVPDEDEDVYTKATPLTRKVPVVDYHIIHVKEYQEKDKIGSKPDKNGKQCSSCGTLYTRDCGCSKGNVEDKILVPKPPKNCAQCTRCGYLVDGPNCQGCALLRQELKENLVTHSPDFQNTFEPSNASTNVVNAPREPNVVKQDHGSFVDRIIFYLNRAPDSPNQFHCFHCKDVLRDGEACKRCTCAKCGSGLGKGLCYICGHNQNSLNDSPSISETSSQSPLNINHCCYECGDSLDGIFCKCCTCKSCGTDAHIGYNCSSKVP
nr:hypothetical protein [Tanacetum cinerariifolium]